MSSHRSSALALCLLMMGCVVQPAAVGAGSSCQASTLESTPRSHLRYSYGVIHRWFPLRWSGTRAWWVSEADLFVNDGVRPNKRRRPGSLALTRKLAASVPRRAEVELIARVVDGQLQLVVHNATDKTFVADNLLDRLLITQQARDIDGRFIEIEHVPRPHLTYCVSGPRGRRLAPRHEWVFYPRRYIGPVLTQLRFCMRSHDERKRKRCSNTFVGGVTIGQLERIVMWPGARRALGLGDGK